MADITTNVSVQVTNGPKLSSNTTQQADFYSKNTLELPPGTKASIELPRPGDVSLLVISPNPAADLPDPQAVADANKAIAAATQAKAQADNQAANDAKALTAANDALAKATDANRDTLKKQRDDAATTAGTSGDAAKTAATNLDKANQQLQDALKSHASLKITYTINDDGTARTLDAPLVAMGPGAVGLLNSDLKALHFTNGFSLADVTIDILAGYTKPAPVAPPAKAAGKAATDTTPAAADAAADSPADDGGQPKKSGKS